MILTCPECATRYSVPDGSVGAEGRTVRCAQCGLTWRADGGATLELQDAPESSADEPQTRSAPGDELPRAFRERLAAQHNGRKAAQLGLMLGGGAALAALVMAALVTGRDGVVQAWPKTASAYAALGMPVNSVGLTIEAKTEPLGFFNGRPAAIVTGTLRNVRDRPVPVPPLRLTLLSAQREVLDTRVYRIPDVEIEPGAKRTFAVRLVDPPEPTQNVEVSFVLEGGSDQPEPSHGKADAGHAKRAPHAAPHAAELRPVHEGAAH